MKNNLFLKGNNLTVMKKMIEKGVKVDLILTDPPYNVSRNHQLGFSNMGRAGMDFGNWDYGFDQLKWLEVAKDLLNKNGSIIIFNDWKNMGLLSTWFENNGFQVKDLLRWSKSNPMPRNVNRRYASDAEYAIWAVPEKSKWVFNKSEDRHYLKTIFDHSIVAGGKNRIHPTQKPLKLLEDILKIHSNEGDIIFDPFAGSGSTGVAAFNLKREFILIERDKKYYDEAKKQFNKISTTL